MVRQRGEAELHDLTSALAHRPVDGGGQRGQIEAQNSLGAGRQQLLAVQAVVGGPFGPMGLHDALKVAAEGVLSGTAGTRHQDGGFQGWVVVVEKCFLWSKEEKGFHVNGTTQTLPG